MLFTLDTLYILTTAKKGAYTHCYENYTTEPLS